MHNLDDKHPTRLGLEPSNCDFRATNEPNEPLANIRLSAACIISLPGPLRGPAEALSMPRRVPPDIPHTLPPPPPPPPRSGTVRKVKDIS